MRFLPLLFCAFTFVAAAAEPVIHRLRVCDDPEGMRCLARSTNGAFEVEMPFAFNDFEMAAETRDGVPLATYTVGARSESGVRFAVTATALKSGKMAALTAEEMMEEFRDRGGKLESRDITHAGLTGFEVTEIQPDQEAVLRSLRSDPCCHYLISVEYPIAEAETARKQMAAFFASLRVLGCPKIVESCATKPAHGVNPATTPAAP